MNLETRARDAAESLRTVTRVDAEDGLRRLHRTHHRRTTGKVIAAVAAVAVGTGVAQVQLDQGRTAQPVSPPPDHWVLVSGNGVGGADNPIQPEGDEWAEPLADKGVQTYPQFRSADPATRRYLVQNMEATASLVMTPGQREPVDTIVVDFGVALGPGPDEVTTKSSDLTSLVVLGPGREFRGTVGTVWHPAPPNRGLSGLPAWSPDGETWAEIRHEYGPDEGSLSVVLRDPDSAGETTLYEHSETAPRWYDAEEHRFASGPGAFNNWGVLPFMQLHWAPDSTRLAFATMTTPEGGRRERHVQWQLFVADTATGEVEQIAELGECAEPVDEDGHHARVCDKQYPFVSWTPDGESLTVLSGSTLTTYDQNGEVLSSEPTDLIGPIVWMTRE